MPDEYSDVANAALERVAESGMMLPSHFWYEFSNVLLTNERRNRIANAQVEAALDLVEQLPHRLEPPARPVETMHLARKHGLTAYDAAYLELALRLGAPLATLDRRLAQAARGEGVTVVEPAAF